MRRERRDPIHKAGQLRLRRAHPSSASSFSSSRCCLLSFRCRLPRRSDKPDTTTRFVVSRSSIFSPSLIQRLRVLLLTCTFPVPVERDHSLSSSALLFLSPALHSCQLISHRVQRCAAIPSPYRFPLLLVPVLYRPPSGWIDRWLERCDELDPVAAVFFGRLQLLSVRFECSHTLDAGCRATGSDRAISETT